MWRTWVDRINATSKESTSVNPETPNDHDATSPEILKRQQEQQSELSALLKRTEDQNLTEKERSDLFLGEFLPTFSKLWEEDLGNGVFIAIDDTRSFMARLTRVLFGGIRQVPEQTTKAGSSQALMDNLRSRSHLFNVITAVKVVAHGPDTFVSLMLQQRIPSIIIKLFRSFIDLPVEYYNDTNRKSADDTEEDDMASSEEVASVITDTLQQFAQRPTILHRLILEDTFFMMVQLLSAKPAEWTDEDGEEEPAFFKWKQRTLEILKCVPMTMEVSQYLRSRRSLGILVQKWSEIVNKQRITALDFREILLGFQLIKYQLQASIDADYFGLYDDFNQSNAWDILATVLIVGHTSDNVAKLKDEIVNAIGQMVFIGKSVDSPILSESSPFQHEDFKYPKATGPKDQIVHNPLAYSCLLTAFAYPNPSLQLQIQPRHKRPIPKVLRHKIFDTLKQSLLSHPVNYFILERLNSVPLLIESMENESQDIQNGILDMLVYIMRDLNFVPLKELAVISLHFQSSASGSLISLICDRFTMLLRDYPKSQTVLRESGFSVVISRMISTLTEAAQRDRLEEDSFEGRALQSFDSIAGCLTEMLKDSSNAQIFKKTYRGNLFDLLRQPTTRAGVLKIFEMISCQEIVTSPSATSPGRSSISSGTTTAGVLSDIETSFSRLMEAIQTIPRDDLDLKISILNSIRKIFATQGSTRDAFRAVSGFVTLVSMIVALEKDNERLEDSSVDHAKNAKMLSAIFAVLTESMRDHEVNKRFFSEHVGYAALENALLLTGLFDESGIPRHVFGILIAFAVEDGTVSDVFMLEDSKYDAEARHKAIEKRLKRVSVSVANPDVLPSVLHLLRSIRYDNDLCDEVLTAIHALARGSRRNQVKMNRSGLILTALEQAYPKNEADEPPSSQKELLVNIVKKLLTMGVGYEEMLHIFRAFNICDHTSALQPKMASLMDLVIEGTNRSRWPNFIQFDMGTVGYSCLEIPDVENFPPQSSGYTLLFWFHIERLDDTMPLTLFTMFDGEKVVFTVYIDAMTRKLQIQQTGYKQKVDFNSFQFQAGYWYHLALVHQRSRLGATLSSMVLYINGVCMESVRCPFPPQLAGDVKCTVGTPRNMASSSASLLIWDLGPTYLIRDLIDEDLLNLYFNLGARYKSLFQDNLRQFQTYEASSALFLSLRHMNKTFGRKEANQSALASAMRGTGNMTLLPESKFAFAFFASNALSRGLHTGLTLTGLSEEALQLVASCTEEAILNSAIAKLESALATPKLMGYLSGNPVIAHPFGVDESIWRIGGCAVALTLIERSESPEMLGKAVTILCETVRYSWRNSEDMERHHGYEILAYLLKKRRELLTVDIVEQLLVFIGKDPAYPEESIINNPFAYRYVFLNFEIWKKTGLDVQKAHLEQFRLFLEQSKRRTFNIRRIQKFQIVKKMLLAFRMHTYSKDLLPHLIDALKIVMLCSWSTDSIRAVATFLASTVSKGSDLTTEPARSSATRQARSGSVTASISTAQPEFLGSQMGFITDAKSCNGINKAAHMRNVVLEMLHDILCDGTHKELTDKFAATITNRWPLLFFEPDLHPYTVVLACRILMHVLVSQGPGYVGKFRVASEGFLVLGKLLPHYWYLTQLQSTLMGAIMGIEVPITCKPEYLKELLSTAPAKFCIPDLMPVVVAMWQEATKFTFKRKSNTLVDIPAMATEEVARTQASFIHLFDELYVVRPDFRDVCCRPETVDAMVEVLFPAVLPVGRVDPETELTQCESDMQSISLMDTQSEEQSSAQADSTARLIKRGGTSMLITKTSPHTNRKMGAMITRLRSASWSLTSPTEIMKMVNDEALESLLEFLVDISVQSITDGTNKNLSGLVLVLQSFPPSDRESKLKFESLLMTHIVQTLKCTLQIQEDLLADDKVLSNVAKFCQMAADAVLQGRFMNGAELTYDLLASIMENFQSPEFYARYGPSSTQTTAMFYKSFNRMILLKISDLEQEDMPSEQISAFLNYCIHHQKIILSSRNTDLNFLRCFCYHLYLFLLFDDENIRNDAANMWKLLLLQKPDAVAGIFKVRVKGIELDDLAEGFRQMLEMDIASFFVWIESRKVDLNLLFKEHISKTWESIILSENKYSQEMLKEHQVRRAAKLKKLQRKQAYEDELLQDYAAKTAAWTQSIQNVEIGRFSKALQDNDGHDNFISSEWARISGDLLRERGLWGPKNNSSKAKWRLDYTEGPQRMRKKIQQFSEGQKQLYQPKHSSAISYTPRSKKAAQYIAVDTTKDPEQDTKPLIDIEKELTSSPVTTAKPVELPAEAATPAEDHEHDPGQDEAEQQMEEEDSIAYEEDKNRKVLRLLDQGDMVLDVYNVSQIAGLDAREGLLLLCKQNIYLIDNFFQRSDGEVVEIWDVPKEERDQYLILLAQAAGMDTDTTIDASGDLHVCRKWANIDIREVYKRRFLFRDVAIEIFFADGRNALITVDKHERDELYAKLASRVTMDQTSSESILGATSERDTSAFGGSFKLSNLFGSSTLHDLTQKWEKREITNFQYLMYLNAIAGRSYNDLTQYPVFPWILADYTSDELDLENPKTFRDLSKPMGAQTPERREEFADRYRQWGETNDPAPAFHYGTHYSSAMIVCSFLIRLEPFTQHYLKLQGGTFDHADRLFDSIGKAWESASEKNMGDVRELIPEFFYLPEFLENVNKFDFGEKQGTGETIDSVLLPPWAHGDPHIFIQKHREALESEYVSQNLHHWIDLIFGYKQQGQAAIDNMNVFHHVSYEGAVDLDAITDVVEKTATIGIINNFGQTPRQLFKKPHPKRLPANPDTAYRGFTPFQDHIDKLCPSILPIRNIQRQIGDIGVHNDRLGVTACQQLFVPSDGSKYIEWGFSDNSLRLFATETGKLLRTFENMHMGFISAACFPDVRMLATGGTDNVVCMWKIKQEKAIDFLLLECLRGHSAPITCLTSSRSYSVLVSGSKDKTAIIWDLNRLEYVRTLSGHEGPVDIVSVNEATGDIITCSGHMIRVWSINGSLYLTRSACPSSENILSCIYYEGKINEYCNHDLLITGHKKGTIKFWSKELVKDSATGRKKWGLVMRRQVQQEGSDIVALSFAGTGKRTLLSGNTGGQVYAYVLPDTTDTLHYVRDDRYKECMECGKAFSVLDRKTHCRTCGGLFCSGCLSPSPFPLPDRSARFCRTCHAFLSSQAI